MNHKYNIMIVDDKEANRNLLNEHVLHLNHTPILAENGMVALKLIEKNPPDAILLDNDA